MVSLRSHIITVNVNELLTLATRVPTISFMVANFVTYEKVLIKRCYASKDLSSFENFSKFLEQVRNWDQYP